ncbi:helix-turn-helix transcriptional regulator [Streptomyces sp. NPDC055078]
MTRDWARLGEKLKAARTEHGMEQQDVGDKIGVKRGALRNIEKGSIAKITTTVRAYARLVGWTDDSITLVLAGGEPVYAAADPGQSVEPKAGRDPLSDLSVYVQQSLREGPLLDSRVADVRTPSGRVRATIVIRGESGKSEEDLLAALRSLRIDVAIIDD